MAPDSSTLAWKSPWMEEPGRLQSMGSLRIGHDWATSLSLFTFMHWRRKWQPMGEPGGLPSMGSHRVGHDWSYLAAAAALKNWCFWTAVLEKTWESLELQGDPSTLKEIRTEYSLEGWCWSWNSSILATCCKEMTHLKRPSCWDRLKAGEEGDDRGWVCWMAYLTQWTFLRKLQELVMDSQAWCATVHGVTMSQTQLNNWTELKMDWHLSFGVGPPSHLESMLCFVCRIKLQAITEL